MCISDTVNSFSIKLRICGVIVRFVTSLIPAAVHVSHLIQFLPGVRFDACACYIAETGS